MSLGVKSPTQNKQNNIGDICRRRLSVTSCCNVGQWSTNHCKRYIGQPRPLALHTLDKQRRVLTNVTSKFYGQMSVGVNRC